MNTINAALAAGIGYFDTAPFYGFGLSERRLGDGLRGKSDVVISTKVGRLLTPAPAIADDAERHGFRSNMPFSPEFDYSHDGIMRSWEASLQRLGLAEIDMIFIHDIGRQTHGVHHPQTYTQLTEGGGLRALEGLRREGSIAAFGIGVNEVEICIEMMDRVRMDVILLAGRYTLLEQNIPPAFWQACRTAGTSIIIGGPFNSGILATGTSKGDSPRYNYGPAPGPVVERVVRLEAVCDNHGVSLPAAALQFPLAQDCVASVLAGMRDAGEVAAAVAHYQALIPDDFWAELQAVGFLDATLPVPSVASRACP